MQLIKSLSLIFFALISLKAHAIDQMYNWNGLEFVTSGNVTHVHPASPQSTVLRGGWTLDISDVEPKATATNRLPYKNQSNALVTVKPHIDPNKVSTRVAQGLRNAAAGAATTGNGYIAFGALACGLFDCGSALVALADWGASGFKSEPDGTLAVSTPSKDSFKSDGYLWSSMEFSSLSGYYSKEVLCHAILNQVRTNTVPLNANSTISSIGATCNIYRSAPGWGYGNYTMSSSSGSQCPVGYYVNKSNQCLSESPVDYVPITEYIQSNYTGKGWDHHWAKMTAEIVKNGGNVFTDGTSTDITGPAIVPVSTSESKTSVSLVPGTTTPAPAGHTGPTESGTQTTTTTTTAHNKYNPAPLTSGSSGSPASGPSMETTQKTTTTTTITNNFTNITNIVNETTTEKDEAPEEAPTDTPFSDLPELYKQKYPDGLIGVLRTQTAAMKATPLFQLPVQLMGDLPQTGQCPSWQLDLSLASWASFGTYNVGADCAIWDFAGWVIVISACILARQLIFGG